MKCFELMVREHLNIKRMLAVARKHCSRMLAGENIRYQDFFSIIEFVRNYADKHHHGKEELLLFDRMTKELGPTAEKLIRYGMNVEHDLGRFYIQELEKAVRQVIAGDADAKLDVIGYAMSYVHLLERHIEKEDNVVYPFAEKKLSGESLQQLEAACNDFEQLAAEAQIRDQYLALLNELETGV